MRIWDRDSWKYRSMAKTTEELLWNSYVIGTIKTGAQLLEAPHPNKPTRYLLIIFQSLHCSYSFHIRVIN